MTSEPAAPRRRWLLPALAGLTLAALAAIVPLDRTNGNAQGNSYNSHQAAHAAFENSPKLTACDYLER